MSKGFGVRERRLLHEVYHRGGRVEQRGDYVAAVSNTAFEWTRPEHRGRHVHPGGLAQTPSEYSSFQRAARRLVSKGCVGAHAAGTWDIWPIWPGMDTPQPDYGSNGDPFFACEFCTPGQAAADRKAFEARKPISASQVMKPWW